MTSRLAGLAAASAILAAIAPALAAQYLCIPDKATGFHYNKTTKIWEVTALKTTQFVISSSKKEKTAYDVKDVGPNGERLPGFCPKDFSHEMLFCETFGGNISLNQTNGRFVRVFWMAYYTVGGLGLDETDEDSGTPMIEIGKCTAF